MGKPVHVPPSQGKEFPTGPRVSPASELELFLQRLPCGTICPSHGPLRLGKPRRDSTGKNFHPFRSINITLDGGVQGGVASSEGEWGVGTPCFHHQPVSPEWLSAGPHMFYLSKTYEERYFNIGYVPGWGRGVLDLGKEQMVGVVYAVSSPAPTLAESQLVCKKYTSSS